MSREVTLYTRQSCGLCEETAEELRRLGADVGFTLLEVDIDGDPELRARFNDTVPVVAVNGNVIAQAPVDPFELLDALATAFRPVAG